MCLVVDVDFCRIEQRNNLGAPAPRTAVARAGAGFHDRVADQK